MIRMWCFIFLKCVILCFMLVYVYVYVYFSKDFCLCIFYFIIYLYVGVIRSIGKYFVCMCSVNFYFLGLGRLYIICELIL